MHGPFCHLVSSQNLHRTLLYACNEASEYSELLRATTLPRSAFAARQLSRSRASRLLRYRRTVTKRPINRVAPSISEVSENHYHPTCWTGCRQRFWNSSFAICEK